MSHALKFKALKLKCIYVNTCFLEISSFSRDFQKMRLIALKYLQCFNTVLVCLHYLMYTVPGF